MNRSDEHKRQDPAPRQCHGLSTSLQRYSDGACTVGRYRYGVVALEQCDESIGWRRFPTGVSEP
ncbi:hypothetical protein CCGE531_26450 (plasmid) [Rhizobium sp. CCGE531]|nr:hypothetical protein CCGE531_26450 [Rhizobium sp. CCGE531]AYG76055.1 hypothetical protein CCGE532_25935 [Rhizobium sp. CCGE532]